MNSYRLSAEAEAALDRPIWSSLTSKHRSLARGHGLALRYPPEIAPFAAVAEFSPEARSDLRELASDGVIAVVTSDAIDPPEGLHVRTNLKVLQMILAGEIPDVPGLVPDVLGAYDAPDMLELATLTRPGPFSLQTHRLGRYIGIRDGNRLAAMTGERMRMDGFTEISAVCVHPDYRGKGYAQTLMKNAMKTIADSGDVSFLHVVEHNSGAIALYEQLGFVTRATFNFTVLARPE